MKSEFLDKIEEKFEGYYWIEKLSGNYKAVKWLDEKGILKSYSGYTYKKILEDINRDYPFAIKGWTVSELEKNYGNK